jgi:hypothetical protein
MYFWGAALEFELRASYLLGRHSYSFSSSTSSYYFFHFYREDLHLILMLEEQK